MKIPELTPQRQKMLMGGAAAGLLLVLGFSFALLAIVPLQPFREIAFAMAAGLLIDAFVVRTLLVPALITLFGEGGSWPGGRLRAGPVSRPATERGQLG